ncbi:MAG: polymer-forming cytoskeletal protein [Myxococcota bacterium]|nr:polymer-forming cytoskeletal protein [Myxococcota bacterium]
MAASAHPEISFAGRVDDATDEERPVILVGESGRFEGLVTFHGSARVDGEVEGEIVCSGTLRLGETARVSGVIEVDELIVAGNLEGEATARQRIELTATARVQASLRTPRLALAEGCVMQGRCETGTPPEDS